jgi:hypothetical protein
LLPAVLEWKAIVEELGAGWGRGKRKQRRRRGRFGGDQNGGRHKP